MKTSGATAGEDNGGFYSVGKPSWFVLLSEQAVFIPVICWKGEKAPRKPPNKSCCPNLTRPDC